MRIGIVSALGRIGPEGVEGYGGLERAAFWMANELTRRGHEVLLFGNLEAGKSRFGWTGVPLETEASALTADKIELLRSCEAVNDWCHLKPLRMARLKNYWATVMFTDQPGFPGRNVYPSAAVREAFGEAGAPLIPIGIPVDGSHTELPPHDDGVACFGRVAHHKGVDLSVEAMRVGMALGHHRGGGYTVAGHVWNGIDEQYAMAVAARCRRLGIAYERDPANDRAEAIIRASGALFHLHRWLESFSIVAGEALCYGTPILTTDQGAPQEWVRATDGGAVARLRDLEAGRLEETPLADFIGTNWGPRREAIAKRARALFSIDRVVPRYERLFERGAAA